MFLIQLKYKRFRSFHEHERNVSKWGSKSGKNVKVYLVFLPLYITNVYVSADIRCTKSDIVRCWITLLLQILKCKSSIKKERKRGAWIFHVCIQILAVNFSSPLLRILCRAHGTAIFDDCIATDTVCRLRYAKQNYEHVIYWFHANWSHNVDTFGTSTHVLSECLFV